MVVFENYFDLALSNESAYSKKKKEESCGRANEMSVMRKISILEHK